MEISQNFSDDGFVLWCKRIVLVLVFGRKKGLDPVFYSYEKSKFQLVFGCLNLRLDSFAC